MEEGGLEATAMAAAIRHGIDPTLVCAVCEQESGWDTWAFKYEPGFFYRYIFPIIQRGELHDVTEEHARASSWGLMQVMGQTAREAGFAGRLAMLCDPATGVEIGCRVLSQKLDAANGDVTRGLELWNGGANPCYPTQVMARQAKYKKGGTDASSS